MKWGLDTVGDYEFKYEFDWLVRKGEECLSRMGCGLGVLAAVCCWKG